MEQTLEELLSQKTPVLYKAGHVSIRQLAEKLRTAMKDASKGGKETKAVQYAYGLPFVKSLKLWVGAVSKCEALKSLIQPLAIVILSAIRAKESHMLFTPYVSILVGLINDLALNCQVFIPISSSVLTALTLCASRLASKTLTAEGREPNITDVVRISERQLKDRRVVKGLTVQLVHELTRHLAFLSRTGALPEVGWIVLQNLKKLSKTNPQVKHELSSLISALEESITFVKEKRKNVDSLFQFEFEETALGRLMVRQKSVEPLQPSKPEEAESDNESSESEEEEDTETKPANAEGERSKRSLKRQRQKEKKRLHAMKKADDGEKIIAEVEKQIAKIDANGDTIVPFEFSSSDEE